MLPHNIKGYLVSLAMCKLKKEDNWQHITYMPSTGVRAYGMPNYLGVMSPLIHKGFYSDNKLVLVHKTSPYALDNIRDYYITLPNGETIKDTCFAKKVYISNKLWDRYGFVFENIELHSGDVISVFSEAAYTIGCYFKLKLEFNAKGECQCSGYDAETKVIEWLPPTGENTVKEYYL